MHQCKNPCGSCPWINSNNDKCFDPKTLKQTIVQTLKNEEIQSCHGRDKTFCAGYLSFVQYKILGGVESLKNGRLAIYWRIISLAGIKKLNTFDSVDEMLESHADRSKFLIKLSGD